MKNKILNFLKSNVIYVVLILIIIILGCSLGYYSYKYNNIKIEKVVVNKDSTVFDIISYNKTLNDLKKENARLYDSLKSEKNLINVVYRFKYYKELYTDTVFLDTTDYSISKVYEYSNSKTDDSIKYKLEIASNKEPNWYKLKVKVSNQFTIVNKKLAGDLNETTIKSDDGGKISDVTVVNVNDKKTFWQHFKIGIGATAGFSPINGKPNIVIGPTITYTFK